MEDRYLFKAKRLDNGEWVIGYYGVIGERNVIIEKYAENYYCPDTCESRHGNQIHEVNSKTICQCTGLKDTDGNLIWENDVVKQFADCNELGNSLYFFYQIRWNNEYSAFEGYEIYTEETVLFPDLEDIEVIGNIFDNPELLESEG